MNRIREPSSLKCLIFQLRSLELGDEFSIMTHALPYQHHLPSDDHHLHTCMYNLVDHHPPHFLLILVTISCDEYSTIVTKFYVEKKYK